MPSSFARSRDMRIVAEAPSESCDAFPAVTVPSSLKDGFSLASPSSVVSGRLHSSCAMSTSSNARLPSAPFTAFFTCIGMMSFLNLPSRCPAAVRCWLKSAYLSWSSREIL